MLFGMPTLIETKTLEECAVLCKEPNLDFIEVSMSLPQYIIASIDVSNFRRIADEYGIFYAIYRGEHFTLPDRKDDLYAVYREHYIRSVYTFRDMCENAIGESDINICIENCW